MEDLYVTPTIADRRRKSAAENHRAICCTTSVRASEWSVLDWNQPAIDFYLSIGAQPQDEWVRYRLTGDALRALRSKAARQQVGAVRRPAGRGSGFDRALLQLRTGQRQTRTRFGIAVLLEVIHKQLSRLSAFSCHLSAELQPLRGSSTALSTLECSAGSQRPGWSPAQRAGSAVEDRANDAAGIAQRQAFALAVPAGVDQPLRHRIPPSSPP